MGPVFETKKIEERRVLFFKGTEVLTIGETVTVAGAVDTLKGNVLSAEVEIPREISWRRKKEEDAVLVQELEKELELIKDILKEIALFEDAWKRN